MFCHIWLRLTHVSTATARSCEGGSLGGKSLSLLYYTVGSRKLNTTAHCVWRIGCELMTQTLIVKNTHVLYTCPSHVEWNAVAIFTAKATMENVNNIKDIIHNKCIYLCSDF